MSIARFKVAAASVLVTALFAPVLSIADSEITAPVVDGMVLKLKDNVLQQVKIRLKSFGPGFCQVTVTLAGDTKSLAAPPLTWSSWFDIGPGISGGAQKLGFSPGCSTGALGEVKYVAQP